MSERETFRHSALAIVDIAAKFFAGPCVGDIDDFVDIIERAFSTTFESARRVLPRGIPRLPWDAFFMLHAHLAATRSTCDRGPDLLLDLGRRGVGAVFVRENRIIAGGYNGSPPGQPHCDRYECPECEAEFLAEDVENPALDQESYGVACPRCKEAGIVEILEGGHLMRGGSCVRTLHAEENALLQCAIDGVSPRDATVYTTASPCFDCAKRLVRVGVKSVKWGADYESRYGLSDDASRLLLRAGIPVEHVDVVEVIARIRGSD